MKSVVFVLVLTVFLSGCATQKDWVATGGSRSDGIVKLSFEEASLERAELNEQQGIDMAKKRCLSWGYSGAEAFGGVTRTCNLANGYGCLQWFVTKEYQCTGKPSSTDK